MSEKETLRLRQKLFESAAAQAFRVAGEAPKRDIERYSDRYLDAPTEPFHSSGHMSIKPGVHFPSELLPRSKTGGKREAKAKADKRSRSTSSAQPAYKRLRKGSSMYDDDGDTVAEQIVAAEGGEDDGEEGDEEGGPRKRAEGQGDDEDVATDVETEPEDEEEDILDNDEDAYGGGFEDGMDDVDSDGGEDEPTY